MRKNTLALLSALAVTACVGFAGCGGTSSASSTTSTISAEAVATTEDTTDATDDAGSRGEATDGALYSEDGVDVREVEVHLVGSSTFNFSVVFANNNDVDKDFDCTEFTIVKGDERIQPTKETKTLDANQSYTQWAFPIREPGSLAVGDGVQVYYGDTLLTELTVEEF